MNITDNSSSDSNSRKKHLHVVKMQLRSQRASDVLRGMNQIRHWLSENPEDEDVYAVLLDAVQENKEKREQIRNLLVEMMHKGSKAATSAMSTLPSNIQDLLADADDAYYAAQYEEAIKLYRQVLKLDTENERAKAQLAKATVQKALGESDTELPKAAVQFYRRARSHIAAREFNTAINLLSAAVETAQAKGMKYIDAENELFHMQNLLSAEEAKKNAEVAIKEERWEDAIQLYEKALGFDPANQVLNKTTKALQELWEAEALLTSMSNRQFDIEERSERLEKITVAIRAAEETMILVNSSLLNKIRSKHSLCKADLILKKNKWLKYIIPLGEFYNATTAAASIIGSKDPIFNTIKKQLNQIRIARIGLVILLLIISLISLNLFQRNSPFFTLISSTSTSTNIVILPTRTMTTEPIQLPTETIAATFTPPAPTPSPTANVTNTLEFSPTIPPLGFGRTKVYLYPVDVPNGKRIGPQLKPDQFVKILDIKEDRNVLWYKCNWEFDNTDYIGWIPATNIEFGIATPTLQP